jgi:hypothetical protein
MRGRREKAKNANWEGCSALRGKISGVVAGTANVAVPLHELDKEFLFVLDRIVATRAAGRLTGTQQI